MMTHSAELSESTNTSKPLFTGAQYDVLKRIAQYVLPALATFYITVGTLWGLPNVEQVAGTITAIDVALGVILGISKRSYNASDAPYDGTLVVVPQEDGGTLYSLEVDGDPEAIKDLSSVNFKVDGASQ
jgi:hypothetical protein